MQAIFFRIFYEEFSEFQNFMYEQYIIGQDVGIRTCDVFT